MKYVTAYLITKIMFPEKNIVILFNHNSKKKTIYLNEDQI